MSRARQHARIAARACLALVALTSLTSPTSLARADARGEGGIISDPLLNVLEPLYVPELRAPVRWAIGFDVGLGALVATCETCDTVLGGVSLDVYTGAQVTSRVAVLVEAWSLLHVLGEDANGGGMLAHVALAPSARVWITPTLWAQAGVGAALLGTLTAGDDDIALSPAATLSFGGEVKHEPAFGLDLALRAAIARYEDEADTEGADGVPFALIQIGISIGWHWY